MTSEPAANGRIAAIFDLDGTLLPEPSLEHRFFTELRRNREIPLTNYLRWAVKSCRLLPHGILAVQHGNKRYLTGISSSRAFRYLDSFVFFEEGMERIAWHAKRNHEIVFLSGTLEPLARFAALALACELQARGVGIQPWVLATQLAEHRGCWTGDVVGEPLCGPGKARAIEKLANEAHFDLGQCHAYANSLVDRQLLSAVGHAHAVNPGRALAALANERDWPIWYWHVERPVSAQREPDVALEIPPIEEHA